MILFHLTFFSFPQISRGSSRHFEGIEAVKRAITIELWVIQEESLQQYREGWNSAVDEGGLLWGVGHVVCCLELG